MATFLFDKIIFGPVKSRRLGVSLGVNLLPTDSKFCNFNCIYCECGWTPGSAQMKANFHDRKLVKDTLHKKLEEMVAEGNPPDVITFAGNGEPTVHPEFANVIADTLEIRNAIVPNCKVAVLSNATMLHKKEVFDALALVDQNILKLDSAFNPTIQQINQPLGKLDANRLVEQLKGYKGDLIIQTMFLRGSLDNKIVDNTTSKELEAWLGLIKEIAPRQVMIYTIARDTPAPTLEKVPLSELEAIAERVRTIVADVQVSG